MQSHYELKRRSYLVRVEEEIFDGSDLDLGIDLFVFLKQE